MKDYTNNYVRDSHLVSQPVVTVILPMGRTGAPIVHKSTWRPGKSSISHDFSSRIAHTVIIKNREILVEYLQQKRYFSGLLQIHHIDKCFQAEDKYLIEIFI